MAARRWKTDPAASLLLSGENMEVFKVFATMSLVDIISNPLKKIQMGMKGLNQGSASLTDGIARLTMGMAPLALAAGGLIIALGLCVSNAIAFEDAMADVAKVVNFQTKGELQEMSDTILEMSGRIPMAADGIAAIISSAAQSGVAKDDLAGFAEQAAKMGVAFDLTGDIAGKMMADWRAGMGLALPQVYSLADAVNHLSNNMNATAPALGEVIQRVGALAMSCGLGEIEVAALGAAFLSAGASPEIASTALKKFTSTLVKGTAMSKRAQGAFAELGISVTQMAKDMQTDAQGTIFKVLEALANKPKELQVSLLTEMFGEEAIGAIAPLLANMNNLTQAFELVGNGAAFAGSMEEEFQVRSQTTSNAIQLLKNKLDALMIVVGSMFTPVISTAATVIGFVVDGLRALAQTTIGAFLLKLAAALSAAVLALTLFGGALIAIKLAMPIITMALGAAGSALAALAWPVLAVVAVVGVLYLAFKHNFGGITDIVMGMYNKVSLVVRGVVAVFQSLNGGMGEIRGELAKDIKANGLLGAITGIAKAFYRVKQLFSGLWDSVSSVFDKVGSIFSSSFGGLFNSLARLPKVFSKLISATSPLMAIFEKLFGAGVDSSASSWEKFGNILGSVAGFALNSLAVGISNVVGFISLLFDGVSLLVSLFTGDFSGAVATARGMLGTLKDMLFNIFDLFGAGDWFNGFVQGIKNAVAQVPTVLNNFWENLKQLFSSFSLTESGMKLLDTFISGIKAKAGELIESVAGILGTVREYLPFSDAKRGPLSALTYSGQALIGTLGAGVMSNESGLLGPLQSVFGAAGQHIMSALPNIPALEFPSPQLAPAFISEPRVPDYSSGPAAIAARNGGVSPSGGKTLHFHIGELKIEKVDNADDLVSQLQKLVSEREPEDA